MVRQERHSSYRKDFIMKTLLALLLSATIASAQTCPSRINLRPVSATSRGGTIIYKSNWNKEQNREQTIEEGNHSQKGAAFLIHYQSKNLISSSRSLELRDSNCKLVARLGRYPRCTLGGCGEHERWYLRSPGGSGISVGSLAKLLPQNKALVRLKGRNWAVVSDVLSEREVYP